MASMADSTLYLYTSLTAGSSHVITATSRLETILKANKIAFRAVDCATDEKARMLWGRRAKGMKLPGIVKFGNVIGDIEQVEEWNEFGELQEQIAAADFAGVNPDAVKTAKPTTNLPLDVRPPDNRSDPPSRASSQGRHISISEPTREDMNATSSPRSPNSIGTSPINITMKQLGAEAAARGAQRKTSGNIPTMTMTAPAPADAQLSPPPTSTAQTPTPATVKAQEGTSEPADAESTAAKTPAVLAAEGKSKTTTDKIDANSPTDAETMPPPTSFPPKDLLSPSDKSTEAQVLDLRRTSTQTRQPSRLAEATHADESHTVLPKEAMAADPETSEPAAEEAAEAQSESAEPAHAGSRQSEDLPSSSAEVLAGARRRTHRGSSVGEADKEQIKKIEEQMRIREDEEPEEVIKQRESTLREEVKPQETEAKDADAAGVSVGD